MEHNPAASVLDIGPVWAGHPVRFCLLTHGQRQYVAYYDDQRRMTVAARTLDEKVWRKALIPSAQHASPGYLAAHTSTVLGWDSHNSVILAVDRNGFLHLSGNMHCNALTYFRSRRPHDIDSFEQVFAMTGQLEDRCTYPRFLQGPAGELIFHYRHGSSGNGVEIYNIYDPDTRTWRRLLDRPLTDGQGLMNAYLQEPLLGPDGWFHMSWVWRDTPDCSTNHDLSYARSRDLVHWTTAAGEPLELPLTLQTPGVIVDPVPARGGIINGTGQIGFDSAHRPLLSYHKFDEGGITQAYIARWEGSGWACHQVSDWGYRWWFEGGGSINNQVSLGRVHPTLDGRLILEYRHVKEGDGQWILDEETLRPLAVEPASRGAAREVLEQVRSDFPGMRVRWAEDLGQGSDPNVSYALRWETLPAHRDRPRSGPLPEASMLQLVAWEAADRREETTSGTR